MTTEAQFDDDARLHGGTGCHLLNQLTFETAADKVSVALYQQRSTREEGQ